MSEIYDIDVIFNYNDNIDLEDVKDCYLLVRGGHCVICLNNTPRGKLIYDLSERFNREE